MPRSRIGVTAVIVVESVVVIAASAVVNVALNETATMIEAVGIVAQSAIVVSVVSVAVTAIETVIHAHSPARVFVKGLAIVSRRTRGMEEHRVLLCRGRVRLRPPNHRVPRGLSRGATRLRLQVLLRSRMSRRMCRLPMKAPLTDVRMDKWLWSVRLFKTRGLAIAACDNGRVKLSGQTVKPSRSLRVGDVITVAGTELTKTVKVLQLIDKRVGAREVPEIMEDLTPQEDYARARERRELDGFTPRPQGTGRPSKKDRRALEEFEQS